MNFLFIVSSLNFGGAEKQAVIDANLLSSHHNVFIITFNDGPLKKQIDNNVNYLMLKKSGYIKTAKKLAAICKENKIDVVHTSLFAPSIISAIATFFNKVNLIWHFHSHEYDIPIKSKVAFALFARFKSVKKIFFVNTELKEFQKRRFLLPTNKLDILYNTTSFSANSIKKKKDFSKVIIEYVGRLAELKRVHYLIDLSEYLLNKKVDNFEICIVGDGEEMDNLREKVNNKKLVNFVKLLGFQKDTQSYYEQFDIFILPSREECLSIALIDAVTEGVPSIAFDVGGNNEIIENNLNGFIVKDKHELFEKTRLLINDSSLRKKFSENAINLSKEKFSQISRKESLIKISHNAIKN